MRTNVSMLANALAAAMIAVCVLREPSTSIAQDGRAHILSLEFLAKVKYLGFPF